MKIKRETIDKKQTKKNNREGSKIDKSKELRTNGGRVLYKALTAIAALIAAFIFALPIIIVNNKARIANQPQELVEESNVRDVRNTPGIYCASAEEVAANGVAEAPRSAKAGLMYIGHGATFTVGGGNIKSHSATYGGAFYVANGGHLIINGGTLAFNQAVYGGAIYVEAGGILELNGGVITGNAAEESDAN